MNGTTRNFHIVVQPGTKPDGTYTIELRQVLNDQQPAVVATLPAGRFNAGIGAVNDAIRASGHKPTALKPSRKTPIPLDEAAGVRAALALNAVHGVTKPVRVTRLVDGVNRLSDEECFYWYAKTLGSTDDSTRRRRFKALRIFLAPE